jgi:hypothetical protein
VRSDIVPGATFPDYALPDHTSTVRKLSELQGRDPMILTLARGRPSFYDLWRDLRAAAAEVRPDWDPSTPGLREAWDAADYSKFHGWDRRSAQSMPTSDGP